MFKGVDALAEFNVFGKEGGKVGRQFDGTQCEPPETALFSFKRQGVAREAIVPSSLKQGKKRLIE